MKRDPKNKPIFEYMSGQLKKRFTYYPMNKSGSTIEDTVRAIRMLDEKHANETGSHYDILIDDYPGVLHTERSNGGKLTRRENDDIVYGSLVDLAGELNFHCVCAIQSNREGSKINRKISKEERGERHRLLSMEDVSEAFGPMMRATNVITLNRSPENAEADIVFFSLCKSRSSRTGMVVFCESNYSHSRTHSKSGKSSYYSGTGSYAEKARGLLDKNNGTETKEIDFHTETTTLGPPTAVL